MSTLILGQCETVARALKWMRRWRVKEASGFVIFFGGEACGWSLELPEAGRNRPGCIAVNIVDGTRHESIGGDYQNGHRGWKVIA